MLRDSICTLKVRLSALLATVVVGVISVACPAAPGPGGGLPASIAQIVADNNHNCARLSDNSLQCWGEEQFRAARSGKY